MQDARDSFFVALRTRLAAINPDRTIVLRGQIRPGILVEENELPTAFQPADAFTLHWTAMAVDAAGPLPLVAMECQINYATDGTSGSGGMDRGRLLGAMDGELTAALLTETQSAVKKNFSGVVGTGAAAVAMATNIFWSTPRFAPAKTSGERLERTATVQLFAYQEAGEL
ncbi:hypothetical protein HDF16_001918 [Granulicella aggregans]|uniref:Uncharacterized protein n=1 Tax=Granulicella aggregans TaxID=474949 RepID=A0A7W7ZCC8_9BACT|nr:hypothetical protein [Granulicella aggregans]MBB5057233.1 hypothetical protein [Granulicella aggregans]